MRTIIFILLITFFVSIQAQTVNQKDKDLQNTINKTILTLQKQRVSNLVAFMQQHNIRSVGYNQANQNYVSILTGIFFTSRNKYPSIAIKKHPNFPANEKGAYVIGVLKGNMPYKNITNYINITGHTFAMFLSNTRNLKSTGHSDLEFKDGFYTLPTSLWLFDLPHYFKPEPKNHVDFQSTIVIPLSVIERLSEYDRKEFHRLFYEINRGLK